MNFLTKNFSLIFVFFAVFLAAWPFEIWAASFSVKPAKQEIILNPGDTIQKKISVTNNLGFNSYFSIRVRDLELTNRANDLFLSDFLNLETKEIFIAKGETKEIFFKVETRPETPPGGAYGYLEISAQPRAERTGEARVSASLGSIVFLRVKGPIKEGGQLLSFGLIGRKVRLATPFPWHFSFENTGNIYLNPYGKILLKNNWTSGQAWVDVPPQSVLPGQTRLFEVGSSALGLPGQYTATLFLNRGYDNIVDSLDVSFWFIPWPIIVLAVGLLLVILVGILLKIKKRKNV